MKKAIASLLALFLLLNCLIAFASEVPPTGDDPFTAPNIIPAESAEAFTGYWAAYCIVPPDGSVIYLQSDSLDMKQQLAISVVLPMFYISETEGAIKYLLIEDKIPAKTEFNPEDGTLKVSTGSGFETVFFLNDNGMISHTFQNNDGEEATAYYKPYPDAF